MKRIRKVTYIDTSNQAARQFAEFSYGCWHVYDFGAHVSVKLSPEDEGDRWVWGWENVPARALRVKAALT